MTNRRPAVPQVWLKYATYNRKQVGLSSHFSARGDGNRLDALRVSKVPPVAAANRLSKLPGGLAAIGTWYVVAGPVRPPDSLRNRFAVACGRPADRSVPNRAHL